MFARSLLRQLFVKYSATFGTGFPNGLQYPQQVSQLTSTSFKVPAPFLDNCSDVTLSYTDQSYPQLCNTGLTAIVLRASDGQRQKATTLPTVQEIRLVRPSLDDVVLPPNYDDIDEPSFNCDEAYPSPTWVEAHGGQGFPYVYDQPFGCSMGWTYNDIVIKACDGWSRRPPPISESSITAPVRCLPTIRSFR